MSVDQRIVAATEQLEADVQLTHEIVHGDENTEVQTDGGLVPTHAKVAKDSNEEIIALLQPTVTDINEHAEYVRTEADRSTSQANESKTARNEAVAARDDAEAIVHEGEGSTTPGGGKYPVAYADGQIDSGWLPLLQAMYPYSGVIGSVDKGDLFFFNQSPGFENRFRFSNSTHKFNIFGRFVEVTYPTNIQLPEAESIAARAIAFDDIFLDWNGNVVTFRSITPHRTTTGYDSDAIATEHGYTKVQTGLYRTSDSATYLLLLGRVARRNQGGYHPLWCPEGTKGFRKADGSDNASVQYWSHSNADKPHNSNQCFLIHPDGPVTTNSISGTIEGETHRTTRPDNKYYDAIYADDFTPLYYSAQNITDRQALLFDSFNRAVAGETFMGAEGTNLGGQYEVEIAGATPDEWFFRDSALGIYSNESVTANSVVVHNLTQNKEIIPVPPRLWFSSNISKFSVTGVAIGDLAIGDKCVVEVQGVKARAGMRKVELPSARPQFLAVDIIGSLDAMPQEWLDNGLPGNWLAVGEEGEDLIPDGTEKHYKLSRKALEAYQVLSTDDNGATWSDVTSTYQPAIEGTGNTLGDQSFVAADCLMVFYRTAANPFELASTVEFLAISRNPLAINGASLAESYIGKLTENMIGKVTVASTSSYITNTEASGFIHWGRTVSSPRRIQRNRLYGNRNTHGAFPYTLFGPVNPCAKHLPMLVSDSGGIGLQIVYKEMWYSSDSWGDDSRFDIVTSQDTVTNLNGETVIVGQKRCALPYHFDGVTL